MSHSYRHAATAVAAAMILTVLTQVMYKLMLSGVGIVEGWPLRSLIWSSEIILFSTIAAASFTALAITNKLHFAWAFLALGGLFNIIQSGIGLSMFLPASEAGENFKPMMAMIVAGAFLFYYLAKAAIGIAVLLIGLHLFRGYQGSARIVGALGAISGLAALSLNIASLPQKVGSLPLAGGAGTLATFVGAICIWMLREQRQ